MHVVVTGGLGFVGSSIASRLVGEGHQVTVLDSSVTSVVKGIPGASLLEVDLTDANAVAAIDVTTADCLMHLAGASSGAASADDPVGTLADGYQIAYNVLELGERLGVERVLHASSMTVYGNITIEQNPVKEDAPCVPISHYAIAKLACERLVDVFCSDRGISFNNLRMFNVYGPGQDLTRMDQGLVSIFVAMLLKSPRIVSRGSLERFRDVVHIDDVVTAWMLCATQNQTDGPLNVGCGEGMTIRKLSSVIADELGVLDQLAVEVAEGTPGDIFGIAADISALHAATGFTPAFPPSRGVRQFTRWAVENPR
jgi:UDP-glucose 4-epimerase